jgi:hypothetical protein
MTGWAAKADYIPGLTNQDFSVYTGSAPKATFSSVKPTGWTISGASDDDLVFVVHPCTGTCVPGSSEDQSAAGPVYLTTYHNPTDLSPSVFLSSKSNYVEADGNPQYENGFEYNDITGLTVGETYSLTFYQGASQQTGFNGATTNQWIVSLGTQGMSVGHYVGSVLTSGCSSGQTCVYYNTDSKASIKQSPLMNVPSNGVVGWEAVSLDFVADAATQELSFLAWGNNGSTVNLPPMAFLAGVDSPNIPPSVPETSTWAMMILGFLGIGGVALRRGKRSPVGAEPFTA